MNAADLERVLEIAEDLPLAPHWPASAYVAAMNPEHTPRRVALVAKLESGEMVGEWETREKWTCASKPGAEKTADLKGHGFSRAGNEPTHDSVLAAEGMQRAGKIFPQGLKPGPLPVRSLGTAEAVPFQSGIERDEGVVVGFAVAAMVVQEAELETIAVAAERQRRGVGGLLLRALVDELKAAQVSELRLEVRASNQVALGFYCQEGFEEAGRRPRYYADPEEDAVLMRLRLA
jgi:ribosomal-protein-alanine acetyltransferase